MEKKLGNWNEHRELKVRGVVHTLLYILNKTGPLNLTKLLKILYFADRKHLVAYGLTISGDDYHAMEHGPVASIAHNVVGCLREDKENKSAGFSNEFERRHFSPYFKIEKKPRSGEGYIVAVSAERRHDPDSVRKSGLKFLDEAIEKHQPMTTKELSDLSHGEAWKEARSQAKGKGKDSGPMDLVRVAEEAGASKDMLEYIRDHDEGQGVRAVKPSGEFESGKLPFGGRIGQFVKNHRENLTLNDTEMELGSGLLDYKEF